jgi:rhodanese-related sulfurtransferase
LDTLLQKIFLVVQIVVVPTVWGYTNLTTAEVHTRLVERDTLLLLDVREVVEYQEGHIAEPEGQLPITPVNLPLNSGVLSEEYERLPDNINIIVYCASGGRSAAASSFLESKGFTRIHNMMGGFSSWTYERRENGFGDHTGEWVRSSDLHPVTIACPVTGTISKIVFPPSAFPATDSIYIELHFASSRLPIPAEVPESEVEGLYRVTALDQFGISKFVGDSLSLPDTVYTNLYPKDALLWSSTSHNMTVYIPGEGWRPVSHRFDGRSFHRYENILRQWYNIEIFEPTSVAVHPRRKQPDVQAYPNPFNSSVHIIAPSKAMIFVYDITGRFVDQLKSHVWAPDESVGSGVYFIRIHYSRNIVTQRVLYLK